MPHSGSTCSQTVRVGVRVRVRVGARLRVRVRVRVRVGVGVRTGVRVRVWVRVRDRFKVCCARGSAVWQAAEGKGGGGALSAGEAVET